jgi:hypothetical protein
LLLGSGSTPSHLLLLAHAPVDQLIDGALHMGGRNTLSVPIEEKTRNGILILSTLSVNPPRKQRMSLVVGHVVHVNPAHAVRGPKHSVKKGKTPVLTAEEARTLLAAEPGGCPPDDSEAS